jgi:hypothetical protein
VSLLSRSLLLFTVFALASFASSLTFLGPFGVGLDDNVKGPQKVFDIKDAILTQPTVPGGNWTLQIDTNYGTCGLSPAPDPCVSLPGANPNNVIPDFQLPGQPQVTYAMSDFLIQQGTNFYGVVLHTHDNPNDTDTMGNIYTQGGLYQSTGFQDAIHFTKNPVLLDAGGTKLGSGTVTAVQNGKPTDPGWGTTFPEYTITVSFSAPAGFLSNGPFTISDSSADCGNAFFTGGGVPEPGTWSFVAPALLLLGFFVRRAVLN